MKVQGFLERPTDWNAPGLVILGVVLLAGHYGQLARLPIYALASAGKTVRSASDRRRGHRLPKLSSDLVTLSTKALSPLLLEDMEFLGSLWRF